MLIYFNYLKQIFLTITKLIYILISIYYLLDYKSYSFSINLPEIIRSFAIINTPLTFIEKFGMAFNIVPLAIVSASFFYKKEEFKFLHIISTMISLGGNLFSFLHAFSKSQLEDFYKFFIVTIYNEASFEKKLSVFDAFLHQQINHFVPLVKNAGEFKTFAQEMLIANGSQYAKSIQTLQISEITSYATKLADNIYLRYLQHLSEIQSKLNPSISKPNTEVNSGIWNYIVTHPVQIGFGVFTIAATVTVYLGFSRVAQLLTDLSSNVLDISKNAVTNAKNVFTMAKNTENHGKITKDHIETSQSTNDILTRMNDQLRQMTETNQENTAITNRNFDQKNIELTNLSDRITELNGKITNILSQLESKVTVISTDNSTQNVEGLSFLTRKLQELKILLQNEYAFLKNDFNEQTSSVKQQVTNLENKINSDEFVSNFVQKERFENLEKEIRDKLSTLTNTEPNTILNNSNLTPEEFEEIRKIGTDITKFQKEIGYYQTLGRKVDDGLKKLQEADLQNYKKKLSSEVNETLKKMKKKTENMISETTRSDKVRFNSIQEIKEKHKNFEENIDKKITAQENNYSSFKKNLTEKHEVLEAQHKELEKSQNGLEKNQNTLEKNQKTLEENQKSLEENQNTLQQDQENLEKRQNSLEDNTNTQLSQVTENSTDMKKKLSHIEDEVSYIRNNLSTLKNDLKTFTDTTKESMSHFGEIFNIWIAQMKTFLPKPNMDSKAKGIVTIDPSKIQPGNLGLIGSTFNLVKNTFTIMNDTTINDNIDKKDLHK